MPVPQLKKKFAPSPRLHPQSDHIINTHTNQVKTLRMDLSWDQFNSSLQVKTHKNSNFGCAGFQEKFDTPPTKTETSFRKLNSLPTKLRMFFPAHLQAMARELCPQTYSLSLPLEWSQVRHTPASIKSGRAYKPKKSAFYSTYSAFENSARN